MLAGGFAFGLYLNPGVIAGIKKQIFGDGEPAATVSVSGRVGAARQTLTNSFGYYRFDEVGVGQNYIF